MGLSTRLKRAALAVVGGVFLLMATSAWSGAVDLIRNLPLQFEPNLGQVHSDARFLARLPGSTVCLQPEETVLSLRGADGNGVLRTRLVGADPGAGITGEELLEGISNYIDLGCPERSIQTVPQYRRVGVRDVYPGIDVVYYGSDRRLEYDFTVRPGADPCGVRLAFEGPDRIELEKGGNLVLHMGERIIVHRAPVAYQVIDGARRDVACRFVLRERGEGLPEAGFAVEDYDRGAPLVIDPILTYSTFLGGSDYEWGGGIAVDAAGNAYLAGSTQSANFPMTNEIHGARGGRDIFIAKLNPAGSALLFSTYAGSTNDQMGLDLALGPTGRVYVTGYAEVYGTGYGYEEAFVVALESDGTYLWSSVIGGSDYDMGYDIAVDQSDNSYVVGQTKGSGFPITNAIQPSYGGGNYDGFLTVVNPMGTIILSTYLGTTNNDVATGVALDNRTNVYLSIPIGWAAHEQCRVVKLSGGGTGIVYSVPFGGFAGNAPRAIDVDTRSNAYVCGNTYDTNFPVKNPIQGTYGGAGDMFLMRVNPTGGLEYATYLGLDAAEAANDIDLDGSTNVYIVGYSGSDVIVVSLNQAGNQHRYTAYVKSPGSEGGDGIAADAAGNAYVIGDTTGSQFPTTPGAYDRGYNGGGQDAFVFKLNPSDTSVSVGNRTAAEGNSGTSNFVFAVTVAHTYAVGVEVGYAASNGTAAAPGDYLSSSGTLTFSPGIGTQSVTVAVVGDTRDEANETFTLNLFGAQYATISDGQGLGTITDDDPPPSVTIGNVTVTERNAGQNTNANFGVTLSEASGLIVTMNYASANGTAVAPGDYTAVPSTKLTFSAGQTDKTVTVVVVGDVIDEDNETFFVNLSSVGNATVADGQGQGTINDNDAPPLFSVNNASTNELDAGQTNQAVFTVALSQQSGKTITVQWASSNGSAVAGADYGAGGGTLTYTAGQMDKTVTRPVYGDNLDEYDETFLLTIRNAANATIADSAGVGTILDNDLAPDVSFIDVWPAVAERDAGSTNVDHHIVLYEASGKTVTVQYATFDGTAVAGDYAPFADQYAFLPGAMTVAVPCTVYGDTVDEFDEYFLVRITNTVNAFGIDIAEEQVIILDDDVDLKLNGAQFSMDGEQLDMSWAAAIGKTYRVQYHTNVLATSGWTQVGADILAVETNIITNCPAGTYSQEYYRVIQVVQ